MNKVTQVLMLAVLLICTVSVSTVVAQDEGSDFDTVVVAGTLQTQLGCAGDWLPDCENSALTLDESSGLWVGTFELIAGTYEYTITVNGTWDVSFGVNGASGMGTNYSLNLTSDAPVTFTFDPVTKLTTVESEGIAPPPAVSAEGGLVIWADMLVGPALTDLVTAFEDEYGIPVTVESMGYGDVFDRFLVAAPAGEGPDIIVGFGSFLGELVTGGLLTPVDLGDKASDFSPAGINALTYNGELYGMPIAIDNVAFFYNTDLLEEPPTTWDEVLEISRELTANNTDDIDSNQYGFVRQQGDPYHFLPLTTSFGGYVFGLNEDGSYNPDDLGIDSPGSVAALQWYADFLGEGLQPTNVDGETMINWFESGRAAMVITGPWFLDRIRESGVNFAIADLPGGEFPAQAFTEAQGFMVSAFSQEPLLAQVFLTEFVATPEIMQGLYEVEQRPYAYIPLMETIEDAHLAGIAHAALNGYTTPSIPAMGAVWEAWQNAILLVEQGADAPESALTTAATQIRAAIAGE
jgi:maltose-binding protein MalE